MLFGNIKVSPTEYVFRCRKHGYQLSLEHGYTDDMGTYLSCGECDREEYPHYAA